MVTELTPAGSGPARHFRRHPYETDWPPTAAAFLPPLTCLAPAAWRPRM